MSITNTYILFAFLLSFPCLAQQNNMLRGKMLFLNSGKEPAIGVEIYGTIGGEEQTNLVYTNNDGSYQLVFQNAREGHRVSINIGDEDENGKSIEIVNSKELELCRIPAIATDEFEIIVCRKGARNLVAQKYYQIIKTSVDIELAKKEEEYNILVNEREKNYKRIAELSTKITRLQKEADSLVIYKEAFEIASINKDNASKRVLRYIQSLDKGKSIQEAREILSIKGASNDLTISMSQFKAAIEELKVRASASATIYDYQDAITCYDTIINFSERMNIDRLRLSGFYFSAGIINNNGGQYQKALRYHQKALQIKKEILSPNDSSIAKSYINIAGVFHAIGKLELALKANEKALSIIHRTLPNDSMKIANILNNIAGIYIDEQKYDKALECQQEAIWIIERSIDPDTTKLARYYSNQSLIYLYQKNYKKSLHSQNKALEIRIQKFDSNQNHPEIANSYQVLAGIYEGQENYEAAFKHLWKALEIRKKIYGLEHPRLAPVYHSLMANFFKTNQLDSALKYEIKAYKIWSNRLSPTHPYLLNAKASLAIIHNSLGEKNMKKKSFTIALENFLLALKFQSNDSTIFSQIGECYYYIKNYSKAIEYLKKSNDLNKGNDNIINDLNYSSLSYAKLGDFNKSKKQLIRLQKLAPNSGLVYRNWAVFYTLTNQPKKAIKNLNKALELGYDDINWLITDESLNKLKKESAFMDIINSTNE